MRTKLFTEARDIMTDMVNAKFSINPTKQYMMDLIVKWKAGNGYLGLKYEGDEEGDEDNEVEDGGVRKTMRWKMVA